MEEFDLPDRTADPAAYISLPTNIHLSSGTVPILVLPQQVPSVEQNPFHSPDGYSSPIFGSLDSYRASTPSYSTPSPPSLTTLNTSFSNYPRSLPDNELQYLRPSQSPFTSPLSSPLHALESLAIAQGVEENQPISWPDSALSSQKFSAESSPFPDVFKGVGANAAWENNDVYQEVASSVLPSDHDTMTSSIENINADVWYLGRTVPKKSRYLNLRPNDIGTYLIESYYTC
jgi:hypothetical protein